MTKLSITFTFAGLLVFCVSNIAAQTGTPGSVPPPSGASTGSAPGGAMSSPSTSSIQTGAGARTSAMPQAQPTVPPSTQPSMAAPSASALQNPLTGQGSGGNVEAGQGSQDLKSYGSGGFSGGQTEQQNVQRVNRDDPRLARFNNEWWYWMPGDYWVYYRNNNWNRYDPYAFQPLTSDAIRYQTGYRGAGGPVYYLDENGLRYRRSYSPEAPKGPALEAARPQENRPQENTQTSNNTQATIGGAVRGQQGPNVGAEIGGAVRNR